MLHGKIWVESEENQGSTFYVSLPYLQAKQKENNSSKKIPLYHTEIKNINVLIVEDDETSLLYLTSIISDKFNNIEVAKNGIEAIEMCKNNSDINCILMDIRMPGIDGYETTKRIRKFNNDIVIIAQTAYALEGDKEKALNVGCNDYISKPINKDKLFEIINKYF
jgi:CheY-like chemotaxis protein